MPKIELGMETLEQCWRDIFSRLAQGGEVAPSQRLRAEGMMQLLTVMEVATEQQLHTALAACYLECFGEPLAASWTELFPFPQIPGFGLRAPVYPSTAE
jgi:hypothetical protein